MSIIYLIIGVVLGGAASWFAVLAKKTKLAKEHSEQLAQLNKEHSNALNIMDKELGISSEKNEQLKLSNEKLEGELQQSQNRGEELSNRLARAEVEFKNLREKLETQKGEMEELQKKFTLEFENIAGKILKQNTHEFTTLNQKNMGEILAPLKEKISNFEKKVEETYAKGKEDQGYLKSELKKLSELNIRLSDEANNLTRALKGDVKKQGNWGEVVLERILERSGLTEGREFEREEVLTNAEGRTIRPDVIIHLPDKKHLIIDSKVSLVAYERYVNEDDEANRSKYIKEHLISLKAHIKELNLKHYQSGIGLNSPDFVLLFIPIESSFSIAIQEDQEIFSIAWDQNVVIVSPSTLLATLRTIASIWQQENQTRNAIEIARQGGLLYDKFYGFITDLEKIGNNLDTTQKNYELAMNKLHSGRGSLTSSVQKLKELGAKSNKNIDEKYLDLPEA